jgi:hypothetical protein
MIALTTRTMMMSRASGLIRREGTPEVEEARGAGAAISRGFDMGRQLSLPADNSSVSAAPPWRRSECDRTREARQRARIVAATAPVCHLTKVRCAMPRRAAAGRTKPWQLRARVRAATRSNAPAASPVLQSYNTRETVAAPAASSPITHRQARVTAGCDRSRLIRNDSIRGAGPGAPPARLFSRPAAGCRVQIASNKSSAATSTGRSWLTSADSCRQHMPLS